VGSEQAKRDDPSKARWDTDELSGTVRVPDAGPIDDQEPVPDWSTDACTGVVAKVHRPESPPPTTLPDSERARQLLDDISETDPHDLLTGALNFGEFAKRLHEEVRAARQRGTELSLLLLDIDHFEQIKTHYGFEEVARLMVEVATVCGQELVPADALGRYAERLFAILLVGEAKTHVADIAQRLRGTVRQRVCFGPERPVTLSLGCASLSEVLDRSSGRLLDLAEERLDEATRAGGDQVVAAGHFWFD
jgi:diguanylate cyclase (GGDEF)-like protein